MSIPLSQKVPGVYRVEYLMALAANAEKVRVSEAEDPGTIAAYAALPQVTAPPITVRPVPGGHFVSDGGHRLAAAARRGDIFISTIEFPT